ncbi:MAG: hypothetical protein IJG09_08845 [Methanobrevibacter sp.]|nr:hypothetical protein [Methanobrevibacter sp.]
MQFKSNIYVKIINKKDLIKISTLFKIARINHKLKNHSQSQKNYEKIIEICNKYPFSEDMLLLKILSLKKLNKSYKTLESIENLLKINPHNRPALFLIANIYKGD